jgi:uncharacterized protein (TIGR02246 family)
MKVVSIRGKTIRSNQEVVTMRQCCLRSLVILLLWNFPAVCLSQESASPDKDEGAIQKAIGSYVKAFNARDAKALAAHWSPDGVYTSRTSGDQVIGRDAISKEFAVMMDAKDVRKLAVTTDSIQFISPNVALERGTATVKAADGSTSESNYRVIFVRRDGKWLIDRVTEDDVVVEETNYEKLKGLEWLIGNWVDQADDISISTECKWTKNQNYISRIYKVMEGDEVASSGLQVIGWDAKQKQIRSWLFDSSGGFVQGTWTQKGDRWMVQSLATLADGTSGSFTSIFRPIDENNYGWKKINRIMAGELMPNIDEVLIARK